MWYGVLRIERRPRRVQGKMLCRRDCLVDPQGDPEAKILVLRKEEKKKKINKKKPTRTGAPPALFLFLFSLPA